MKNEILRSTDQHQTNSSLELLKKCGLVGVNYNYSELANTFLSLGYTSSSGNTYFNAVRFAEGIIIQTYVGEGWLYTFLNGIKIYSIKDKIIISEEYYHNRRYSESGVKNSVRVMLLRTLKEAASANGQVVDEDQANEVINSLLTKAFAEDQRYELAKQVQKYLS